MSSDYIPQKIDVARASQNAGHAQIKEAVDLGAITMH
jgi:hypothetical protein